MEIDANRRSVQELFTTGYQFRVPPYQRPYAWGSNQIDELWTDIVESDNEGHFMGPLVIYKKKEEQEREVIDGQQRLSTIQMLLGLIRDKYVELGTDRADDPHSLIWSHAYAKGDKRFRFRSGKRNWEVLRDFMLRHPSDDRRLQLGNSKDEKKLADVDWAKNKPLVKAYERLHGKLEDYLEDQPSDDVTTLSALEQKLVFHVDFVAIEVTGLADAFLLFETLNDRGLQLSAADLLKSHLLAKLDDKYGDETMLHQASDEWDDLVEQLGGGDITRYLRHYLLMTRKKVRKSDIFPTFQEDVKSHGPKALLADLRIMGDKYAQFLNPRIVDDSDKVRRALQELQGINVVTHYIPLLPARRWLDDDGFTRFARLTEVMTFRWTVSGLNAQQLESLYQEAASVLHKSEGEQLEEAEKTLVEALPPDEQFKEAFRRERMGVKYVARYMLRKLENGLREKSELELAIKPPQTVHIEHVMPSTSTDFWEERVRPDEDYDDVVSRWGNLTLLHEKPNKQIQNGPWTKKVEHYSASDVTLTNSLAVKDDWTSLDIDVRQQWMALAASRVWSLDAVNGKPLAIPSYEEVLSDPEAHGLEVLDPDDLIPGSPPSSS